MNNKVQEQLATPSRLRVFVIVFMMLCGLTAISFWISRSPLMDDARTGWAAMMVVSLAKSMLVAAFFMHLWWERAWKYVLTIPAIVMGIVLVLLLIPDVGYRTQRYSQDRIDAAAAPNHGNEMSVGFYSDEGENAENEGENGMDWEN